jgi:PAS domain S-box-containing protein
MDGAMNLKMKHDVEIESKATSACKRHDPPALSMDERGMILDCSKSFETLSGYLRSELVWQPVSRVFPQMEGVDLVKSGELNPVLYYLCRCGHHFHVQNKRGEFFANGLSMVRIENNGRKRLRMIVHHSDGQKVVQ